ncbi:MAG: Eco57I restriction-modification methylase domain-containing protein [Solirubrobacteraceae bacterium]
MRLRSRDLFQTVHTEGGLLPADLLRRVADGDRTLAGLTANDYHLDPGERLNERITRAWTRLTSAWHAFDQAREQLPPGDAAGALTRERWLQILFDEFGYGRLVQQHAVETGDKQYPIFSQWLNTPIHLIGVGVSLDHRTAGVRGAAGQSPHSLVQELLNRSPDRLWGMVSNGLILRVLRDNVSLTRQAFVQFDLEAMFTGEVYSDFALLWLVCHESRVEADKPEECWLERWSRTAADTGTRALEALRDGVEEAIKTLGAGFLAHPANAQLHGWLQSGQLDPLDYYRALLRLVYRLLFLFVAEDRDALLDPNGSEITKRRYREHYSTAHLRELASKRRGARHHDRYEQLKLVMRALDQDGQPALALPALGSYLWDPAAIGPLADAKLANEDLFAVVRALATVEQDHIRRAVDFRNLGAEELGSVYESLLELHPTINRDTDDFKLTAVTGSERKTTGSYYTPTSLISSLLDTALEPVLDEAARKENAEQAILELAVVDPACGSEHFLIAAANRIAKRLAAIRSDDPEPSPGETRAALRDVVGHCIHGVDVNPMAVELCKVSLWMEALEPGRPLSFLDHKIVLGNSLLGTTPELISAGIPADAFKPILGDDKRVVTELRKQNEKQLAGQLSFDVAGHRVDADTHAIATEAGSLAGVDDQTLAGVREQQQRFEQLLDSPERRRAQLAADTWCTAFVAPKDADSTSITQDVLTRVLSGGRAGPSPDELAAVAAAKRAYSFLHWHVAFPTIWERGGFDVVLGNPPWDRVKLQEKEFFAARSPAIASAPSKAARDLLIKALAEDEVGGGRELHAGFEAAKRQLDGVGHFVRESGRFPLCGRGPINTYAIFAELMRNAIGPAGRVGMIVPTGIATDDTTKFFFRDLNDSRSLASLYDFENRAGIFPAIDSRIKFSLLTLTGRARPAVTGATFVFFAHRAEDLEDPERRFILTAEDIELLNPNTRTCPVFRTRRDAEITKAIYRRVPVLVREGDPDGNPWAIELGRMLHMSDDSHLFRTRDRLEADGATLDGNVFTRGSDRWLPLYEAKMIDFFDHRRAGVVISDTAAIRQAQPEYLTDDDHADPQRTPAPRVWVSESDVNDRLGKWTHSWLGAFCNVTSATNERTLIFAIVPRVGVGHSAPLVLGPDPDDAALLVATMSSFACDYVVRQKLGGINMTYGYLQQFPVPLPSAFSPGVRHFVIERVLELTYTATDLAGFASDLGHDGPPFHWDPDRRALLRAELDAAMFRLYGIERDDVDYIMETFPIVRRRDEERFSEYRTKRLILERYDALIAAHAAGAPYETPLDPPPGDPHAAHGAARTATVS